MISPTAEYALRAVVCLGNAAPEPQTNQQIAEATKVPPAYLSKVLQGLARAGIVRSQRGLGGGYTLLRDLDEVTVLEVVETVDPLRRIESCPLDLAGHGKNLCPLHRHLDGVIESVIEAFGDTTIGDLVREPRSRRGCRFPLALRSR
ncbi:MAG: RrF2 family transcriptional regulator [Planctomycetota bacterium JB042]